MTLSSEQVQLFHNNGYMALPGQLPAQLIDELMRVTLDNMKNAVDPVVRDDQNRVMRISQVWDRQPIYQQAATHEMILEPLEDLLGPSVMFTRNRHNHATLNLAGSSSTYWHRDSMSWTRNIVSVIIYLEPSTTENGCTQVVPGTHKIPWTSGGIGDLTKNQALVDTGVFDQAMPALMPAGGMMLINSLVFHRIGDNKTDSSRMSVTFGYHSGDELYGDINPQAVLVRGEPAYTGNIQY